MAVRPPTPAPSKSMAFHVTRCVSPVPFVSREKRKALKAAAKENGDVALAAPAPLKEEEEGSNAALPPDVEVGGLP